MERIRSFFATRFELPGANAMRKVLESLSPFERIIFGILFVVCAVASLTLLGRVSEHFMVSVPAKGGSIHEGYVGSPLFVNPLLANSDTDRDLSALVFAGLMRPSNEGLVPELAKRYEISDDGRAYTFYIRDDATFHDGFPVTADDIIFTIESVRNPLLKSPRRSDFEGVGIERVDDLTVRFMLPEPYAPFLESTTLGIIPKHIWGTLSPSEFAHNRLNLEPIGAGPFRADEILRSRSEIPEAYRFSAFPRYVLGRPYVSEIVIHFYSDEESMRAAYAHGDIEAMQGIAPEHLSQLVNNNGAVVTAPLPRVFALFFNQNKNTLLADPKVRSALSVATPRDQIIGDILSGYGTPLFGPIPPNVPGYVPLHLDTSTEEGEASLILSRGGFKKGEDGVLVRKTKTGTERMAFVVAAPNTPELKRVADAVVAAWQALGIEVTLKIFEPSDLTQNVIRPREFEILLFGEIVGREVDLFAFWHSSQRNDPGVNIALYTNREADELLEEARATLDPDLRTKKHMEFVEEVIADVPAAFLYAPDFIYVIPKTLGGVSLSGLSSASERYMNVHQWFLQTERVWGVFAQNEIE